MLTKKDKKLLKSKKIVSLFSGAGGLDLGFEQAGYDIVWANDYDKDFWATFEYNFPKSKLVKEPIQDIPSSEIPDCLGILGGPPCQSWSLAGSMRGIEDNRGKVFYEYLRVLRDKKPLFFLAENVPGMISRTHFDEFVKILNQFEEIGYTVKTQKMNAADYGVPQSRIRVFIIGYRNDLGLEFEFPKKTNGKGKGRKPYVTQKDAFGDLPEPVPSTEKNYSNGKLAVPNHEYFTGAFSSRFMSRNRKRGWDEIAYTIEASGRHAKVHPSSNDMIKLGQDEWKFDENTPAPYRRLSVRESARVQTFPDDHIFIYDKVDVGYKMVGNAVPVKLAFVLAKKILEDFRTFRKGKKKNKGVREAGPDTEYIQKELI